MLAFKVHFRKHEYLSILKLSQENALYNDFKKLPQNQILLQYVSASSVYSSLIFFQL